MTGAQPQRMNPRLRAVSHGDLCEVNSVSTGVCEGPLGASGLVVSFTSATDPRGQSIHLAQNELRQSGGRFYRLIALPSPFLRSSSPRPQVDLLAVLSVPAFHRQHLSNSVMTRSTAKSSAIHSE